MMAAVMTAITLGELLGGAAGARGAVAISDLTLDSRAAGPGSAFVAIAGTREHGLRYAADALGRGAEIVLYEPGAESQLTVDDTRMLAVPGLKSRLGEIARRFYWRERSQPALFGVTGTNGKTTVAWLVAQALRARGNDCAYVGTLGYGRPGELAGHALTTPDCLTLHRELATLAADSAALEVSSHGLVQGRVAGLDFVAAAVTNLSRDHLDAHKSMEEYGNAKARILNLPALQAAVLNADDEFAAGLVARVPPGVRTLRVSLRGAADADISAVMTDRALAGLELAVRSGKAQAKLRSPLIGDFNAENLLVALGLVVSAGSELEAACNALSACTAAPGRLEVFPGDDGMVAVVDYAHTPAALERALAVVAAVGKGRKICVFGCGGERDRGKRALMGRAAGAADRVVLTNDNPRGEDPAAIVADIEAGLRPGQPYEIELDRERAIRLAIESASPGDVVLVAGKGHETTQALGADVRTLDDRQIVRDAVAGRTGGVS